MQIRDLAPDSTTTVRVLSKHALSELIRIRTELEATSRLLAHAHLVAGSDVKKYQEGDTFAALVVAGRSTDEAIGLVNRFLDLGVAVARDPLVVLSELDAERGIDRDLLDEAS